MTTITKSQWEATAQHHDRMAAHLAAAGRPEDAATARSAAAKCRSNYRDPLASDTPCIGADCDETAVWLLDNGQRCCQFHFPDRVCTALNIETGWERVIPRTQKDINADLEAIRKRDAARRR